MSADEIISSFEKQIFTALVDYFKYVRQDEEDARHYVKDNYSERFIKNLACDCYYAKSELREMFRKSPAWNENLQALIINGNRTHESNNDLIKRIAWQILLPVINSENQTKIYNAVRWFTEGNDFAESLLELAPKANLRQKKSKVFIALCKALGIWQDNGEFQKMFSDLCNEFNAKKIDIKLYVSLNPAHFLTSSNPHCDKRGATMQSCHSLNSGCDYRYGVTGYARDNVSFVAFTASDDKNPETLNNRKTSRQLFMYEVGNGLLLQSRLYKSFGGSGRSYGGVNGDECNEVVKLYRELIQREISDCEQFPNFWAKPVKYTGSQYSIPAHSKFKGYADWIEIEGCAIVSATKNENHRHENFVVGESSVNYPRLKSRAWGVKPQIA